MIEQLLVKNFPVIKHQFTKKVYLYFGVVFFLFNYYLYSKNFNVLIAFIALIIIGYILNRENNRILEEENIDFEKLEDMMEVLIPKANLSLSSNLNKNVRNYLYVDLNVLQLLYKMRAFRLKSNKMFNETVNKVSEFLGIYEKIKESKRVLNSDLQLLASVKKQALNNFHSIVFRITEIIEIQRHNEFRYLLEEKLNALFLECVELSSGHINLNSFAYDMNFNKYYDVY
jgi:hypothetical protein